MYQRATWAAPIKAVSHLGTGSDAISRRMQAPSISEQLDDSAATADSATRSDTNAAGKPALVGNASNAFSMRCHRYRLLSDTPYHFA